MYDCDLHETSKIEVVSYTLIEVVMGMIGHARLMTDKNVGALLHCYTYICVV